MANPKSPLWRRAFDGAERRVGKPLALATSSEEFHAAGLKIRKVRQMVSAPIQAVAGLGLHVAGLPSPKEVRELRKQLGEVQQEVSALRREKQVESEREQDGSE